MTTLQIEPLPTDIEVNIQQTLDAAPTVATIANGADYLTASELLQQINRQRREVEKHYASIKQPINAARKHILALEKTDLARLTTPATALSAAIVAYEDAQAETDRAEAQSLLAASREGIAVAAPSARVVTPEHQYRRQSRTVTVNHLGALIAAVAAGDVPLSVLSPNQTILNRMAREQGDLFAVPGCAVNINTTVVTR